MLRVLTAAVAIVGALFLVSLSLYVIRAAPGERATAWPRNQHSVHDADLEHIFDRALDGDLQGASDAARSAALGRGLVSTDSRVKLEANIEVSPAVDEAVAEDALTPPDATSAAAASDSDSPAPDLSPALLPGERPEWTTLADDFDSDTHRLVVVTLPCNNVEDCREELRGLAIGKVERYAQERVGLPEAIATHIGEQWIEKNLLDDADEYVATFDEEGETLYQIWSRVGITHRERAEMRAWQYASEWNERSTRVAASALIALSCVGLLHLAFAAKTATSKRRGG